jgi:PKD repeat protein
VGTYYLEATVLSCVDRDTFELSLSKMSMHPRFLAASNVLTLDSVKFIELSYPNPIHYNWDFKDGTSDTIADPVHVFYLEGSYDVTLIAENSECQAEISKQIIVTAVPKWNNDIPVDSSKNKPNSPKFTEILSSSLFPNPNNGQFTLKVELSHKTNVQIAVFDLTGRIIFLKDYSNKELINEGFNFNSLGQGYYFLSIKTINETKTFKISVVR